MAWEVLHTIPLPDPVDIRRELWGPVVTTAGDAGFERALHTPPAAITEELNAVYHALRKWFIDGA